MGLRDLFSKRTKDEVAGTKLLVASLDPKFAESAKTDCRCYSQFYPTPTEAVFESSQKLFGSIAKGYDIVHLFCAVSPEGSIIDGHGNVTPGATLIQRCCDSDVKLLWLAAENRPESYIKGFKAAGNRLNLVLTIDRKGPHFSSFLANLLRKMSAGETMPAAWVSLSPQNSNDPRNQEAPACIFAAGRGGVRLR